MIHKLWELYVNFQPNRSHAAIFVYIMQYFILFQIISSRKLPFQFLSYLPPPFQSFFEWNSLYSHFLKASILPIYSILSTISYTHIRKYSLHHLVNKKYQPINTFLSLFDAPILLFPWTILPQFLTFFLFCSIFKLCAEFKATECQFSTCYNPQVVQEITTGTWRSVL